MMLPNPLDCQVRIKLGRPWLDAKLLGFVPVAPYNQPEEWDRKNNPREDYTVDALVILKTFDGGKIYQVKMYNVADIQYE